MVAWTLNVLHLLFIKQGFTYSYTVLIVLMVKSERALLLRVILILDFSKELFFLHGRRKVLDVKCLTEECITI